MSTAMQEPARIRGMFTAIARTYDPLNHVLSMNQDKSWRRFTVEQVGARPGDRVLDVCTGTADLAIELSNAVGPSGSVVGTDFCEAMVRIGVPKAAETARAPVRLGVADTLHLPFKDASFRGATVGFGIRNVADLSAGIREMARVVAPGGRIAILEFTQPPNPLFRFVYYVYFLILLPILGNLVTGGKRNAYGYLPRSVLKFPDREKLRRVIEECGLVDVRVHARSFGIITVHVGNEARMKHLVVAITGASGVRYGMRLLEAVHGAGIDLTIAVSKGGARVLEIEEGVRVDPEKPDAASLLRVRKARGAPVVRTLALSDIAAGVCSGTHPVDGMIVVPCSMGTLSRIASGNSANVIERAADVMLKEGRPLVLVPREAPLSRIHLENMLRAHDAGAAIVPASPGFYHRPESIDDLVDQVVTKTLDRLGLRLELIPRWKTPRSR